MWETILGWPVFHANYPLKVKGKHLYFGWKIYYKRTERLWLQNNKETAV
jgi:hypothetical protein